MYFLGLSKMKEASETLVELDAILDVQNTKVSEQTQNCETLLASIQESTDITVEKKTASLQKRREIEERNDIIKRETADAQRVLMEAQPALDSAKLSLEQLDKADITEIRFLFPFLHMRKCRKLQCLPADHSQHLQNRSRSSANAWRFFKASKMCPGRAPKA